MTHFKIYNICNISDLYFTDNRINLAIEEYNKVKELLIEEDYNDTFYVFPQLFEPISYEASDKNEYLKKHPSFKNNPESYKFHLLKMTPGHYYPRIFRPILRKGYFSTNSIRVDQLMTVHYKDDSYIQTGDYTDNYTLSLQNLATLKDRLVNIFNNIYPNPDNFSAYGYEIRNLLILACTEVEAQMKGILKANGYKLKTIKTEDEYKFTMNDYFKLFNVLQLNNYTISLPYFPKIGDIRPFEKWTNNPSPTKTLDWYNDYNYVKHDNEIYFNKASLLNAVNAICGVYVLFIAQFGNRIPNLKELIGNFFQLKAAPNYNLDECYIPPFSGNVWNKEQYRFT